MFVRDERPWLENQLERPHNISLLYKCTLSGNFELDNGTLKETDAGYKKWFDCVPDNLLKAHKDLYGDIL